MQTRRRQRLGPVLPVSTLTTPAVKDIYPRHMIPQDKSYFIPGETHERQGVVYREFIPTIHTASPWGEAFQHGAPPAALLTHALELGVEEAGLAAGQGRFTRVTTDILGAVPLSPLIASARIVRPGRRISLLEATVQDPATGRDVVRGSAWWIHTQDLPELQRELAPPMPSPEEARRDEEFFQRWGGAYIDTIDVRTTSPMPRSDVSNAADTPGATGVLSKTWDGGPAYWLRTEFPVIKSKKDTPWMTMTKLVDSANGLGTGLSPEMWNFMNVDTTVYLHRLPVGEWIGVLPDANYGPDGTGVTITRIYDSTGPVGTANQSIMLSRH